ncbi:MAG: putative helicase [Faunusvirus sp.]|jgi:P4 family phage/plasmid primase-like protien|uniref:Putative helicase n=1 Tax=Faunusvirus sp. TaxID=2487766 RepID=A0A3G5A0K3_9VIRU|nr:MAG: putative helicase [Faunusvirus sp.]
MSNNINKPHTAKLYQLMETCRIQSHEKRTHTSMGYPFGNFGMSGTKRNELMKYYSLALKENTVLHITEQHREQGPIIIDIDLKYKDDNGRRLYLKKHIIMIIKAYNIAIVKYIKITDSQLQAFVFEKKSPTQQPDNLKDGFHIQYPYVCINHKIQFLIRNDVLKQAESEKWFSEMDLIEPLAQVFDIAIIQRNNWLMYKSVKPNCQVYELTCGYDDLLEEVDIGSILEDERPDTFSIRKFAGDEHEGLQDGITDDIINAKYLTLGLEKKQSDVASANPDGKTINPDDIAKVGKLIKLLSPDRYNHYDKWIELGWCLHNINNSLLGTWIDFSKQSAKFVHGDCEKRWNKFRNDGFNMGSLYKWARDDSPDGFSNFKSEELRVYIQNSMSGASYDVAKLVHEHYKYNYVCLSLKYKTWYEFKNHRWIEVQHGHTLNQKIAEEIVNEYTRFGSWFGQKSLGISDKDGMLSTAKLATNMSVKLRTKKFRDDIMSDCAQLFYDPLFIDKLDENRELICFTNGVYDLANGIFREGRPEDRISLCTLTEYRPYNKNDRYVKDVEEFINQIQPEKDMRNYVLDLLASCLQGHTRDEKFHIWTGSGCFAAGTQIMMSDGTIKSVEDITVNEYVMGNDYKPRLVTNLINGRDHMYIINQNNGASYTVNGDHKLVLKVVQNNIKMKMSSHAINKPLWQVNWYKINGDGFDITKHNIEFVKEDDANEFLAALSQDQGVLLNDDIIVGSLNNYLKINNEVKKELFGIKMVKNKNGQISEILSTITTVKKSISEYYGFEIGDNHLFLLEDGTIVSNSNGKSVLVSLFMQAFGEYCATIPVTLLTGKRAASNAACPELARTKGRRFCCFHEPEGDDKINLGYMKGLTAGDKLIVRTLFKEPIEFFPQFKLFLLCNKLPSVSSNDGGTWRRIRLVPYEMKFVDNPKEVYERKIDRSLKEKLDFWKEGLISILVERFKVYKANGLVEPHKVTQCTTLYQQNSDTLLEFINETMDITKNSVNNIKLTDIMSDFKDWFRRSHSDKKMPPKGDVKEYFETKFGKQVKGGYCGIVWKKRDDEDNEDAQPVANDQVALPVDKSKKKKSSALDA